jgi:hypothetical protein
MLRLHVAAASAFVLTTVARFLALNGFPNDHFIYLAPAQQMLLGQWPSRDFVDPGTPLMYVVSAAVRWLVGAPLLAEGIVVAVAFGLAAALTIYAAFRASGSLVIAAFVTLLEVTLFPRSYHYPKLLLYAAAIVAMWRYAEAPSRTRAAWLAGCVVIAFLFRHDHGIYLGAAAVLTAGLAGGALRLRVRRALELVLLLFLFSAPYVAFVAATTGLRAHIAAGAAYSRSEAERTMLGMPRIDRALTSPESARVILFYAFHALPLIVLAAVAWRAKRAPADARTREVARLVPVALLAIAANLALLRDPLQARLPDVVVPAAVLGAWLLGLAWRAGGAAGAAAKLAAAVVVAIAVLPGVNAVGGPAEQVDRMELRRVVEHARELAVELREPFPPRQMPSRFVERLVPFLEYVGRCTGPNQRLLIAGEAPELFVFARRPFAGGQPALRGGFFSTVEDQRRFLARLAGEEVPLALVIEASDAREFPFLMDAIEKQFTPLTSYQTEERGRIDVLVSRTIAPRATDAVTGLPCFRGR